MRVDELPWELAFRFLRVREDDGRERWALVGLEIGERWSPGEDVDVEPIELTPERMKIIEDGFGRYRKMAEHNLIATLRTGKRQGASAQAWAGARERS
jgi:hypothetical protein